MTVVALYMPAARVPASLVGPMLAIYWTGAAFVLAWALYTIGVLAWTGAQFVAWYRLRRVMGAAVLASLPLAVVAAQEPVPPLPSVPMPSGYLPSPLHVPTLQFIVLPPDANPNDVIGEDVIVNCDYFPWSIECWFYA